MNAINKKTWLQTEDTSGRVGVCCGIICAPYCKKAEMI